MLVAITDASESTNNHRSILVDRENCRARVNNYDAIWSTDLTAIMSEIVGKKVSIVDNFDWSEADQTPKTKAA